MCMGQGPFNTKNIFIWIDLQTWATTILVVSHDRSFLNAVCTDIIHLHSRTLITYKGNYDQFDKTKDERLKNQKKEYEAQKQYREHIQVLYVGNIYFLVTNVFSVSTLILWYLNMSSIDLAPRFKLEFICWTRKSIAMLFHDQQIWYKF